MENTSQEHHHAIWAHIIEYNKHMTPQEQTKRTNKQIEKYTKSKSNPYARKQKQKRKQPNTETEQNNETSTRKKNKTHPNYK